MTGPLMLPRSRMVALVTAGLLAGGAGGFAISQLGVATASSPAPPSPYADGPFGHGLGHMGGPGMLGMGGGRVLHGEATVAKAGGGTMTVRFQSGTISGISGSTVTVKSSDGFTSTFTVNSTTRIVLNGTDGTLSKLAKNDTVRVMGVQNGSATVAKAVLDGMPPRGMFGGMLGHRFGHRMPAPQAPGKTG